MYIVLRKYILSGVQRGFSFQVLSNIVYSITFSTNGYTMLEYTMFKSNGN